MMEVGNGLITLNWWFFFGGFITPNLQWRLQFFKKKHLIKSRRFCSYQWNTPTLRKSGKNTFISLNQREHRHFARGTKDKSSFNRSWNGQRLSDLWDSFQVNESYESWISISGLAGFNDHLAGFMKFPYFISDLTAHVLRPPLLASSRASNAYWIYFSFRSIQRHVKWTHSSKFHDLLNILRNPANQRRARLFLCYLSSLFLALRSGGTKPGATYRLKLALFS